MPTYRQDSTPLTKRQQEVLTLLLGGATNRQIAAQLGIALGTVNAYVGRIFAKLGVHDRRTLAAVAARQGLLSPAEGAAEGKLQ
jgi:DNA-binding NarL/FixJ family response regulator